MKWQTVCHFLSKKIIILHYIFHKVLLLNVGNKKYKLFLKNVF